MKDDDHLDRFRILLNDADFDRVSRILADPPKLSPEATERLRRKLAWETD
jgi:hypothetical protein